MVNSAQEKTFLKMVKALAGKLPGSRDVMAMYYCMLDNRTPAWVKAQIAIVIAYVLNPADACPDVVPLAGFADDGTAIFGCLKLVGMYVTEEHRNRANSFFDS
jgi:uncharacterized membrane protein YkvA (DUF1232 family)